jgi:hypothetical protein
MNSHMTKLASGLIAGLVSVLMSPANAVVIGGSTITTVNNGVVLDGTEATRSRYFAKEFSISKHENETTFTGIEGRPVYTNNPGRNGFVQLSDLPVNDPLSPEYFRIVFNANEPGRASEKSLNIDDLVVTVGNTVVFNFGHLR